MKFIIIDGRFQSSRTKTVTATSSKTPEASTATKTLTDTTTTKTPKESYKTPIPTKIPTDSGRFRQEKTDFDDPCYICYPSIEETNLEKWLGPLWISTSLYFADLLLSLERLAIQSRPFNPCYLCYYNDEETNLEKWLGPLWILASLFFADLLIGLERLAIQTRPFNLVHLEWTRLFFGIWIVIFSLVIYVLLLLV